MSNTEYRNSVADEGYDQDEVEYDESSPGLFGTRGRTLALGGSVVALLIIFSAMVYLLGNRANTDQGAGSHAAGNIQTIPVITSSNPNGGAGEAPAQGSVAPDFQWTDITTNQPVKLSSLRGKPVWVNFWGTWCPPCRGEMPEMQKAFNKYKDQITIIGVSMGPRDNPDQVKGFVNQYAYNWLFVHDDKYETATRYEIQAVPSSYFIGRDGVIKAVQIGGMTADMIEANLQQIK
ncbi:MAG: redoxin domain-containing protein [Chloroflexota bacterium]|nr:redoxin domain-containing protein [Chloroflexota bacterium]